MTDGAIWIPLVVAGLTFIGSWATVRQTKTRDLTGTALALITPLEERIDHLEDELAAEQAARTALSDELREQRKRRYELEARVIRLEDFLRSEGYDPGEI